MTQDVAIEPGPALDPEGLDRLARRGRLLVLETVANSGAGHIGGPLSATLPALDPRLPYFFRVVVTP